MVVNPLGFFVVSCLEIGDIGHVDDTRVGDGREIDHCRRLELALEPDGNFIAGM